MFVSSIFKWGTVLQPNYRGVATYHLLKEKKADINNITRLSFYDRSIYLSVRCLNSSHGFLLIQYSDPLLKPYTVYRASTRYPTLLHRTAFTFSPLHPPTKKHISPYFCAPSRIVNKSYQIHFLLRRQRNREIWSADTFSFRILFVSVVYGKWIL